MPRPMVSGPQPSARRTGAERGCRRLAGAARQTYFSKKGGRCQAAGGGGGSQARSKEQVEPTDVRQKQEGDTLPGVLLAPCSSLRAPCSLLRASCFSLRAPCSLLLAPCFLLLTRRSLLLAPCFLLLAPCSLLLAPRFFLLPSVHPLAFAVPDRRH